MSRHTAHVRIDGEPFLSRAKVYREQRHACLVAWSAFAKDKGADGIPSSYSGLNFSSRRTPKGWTKPSGRYGFSKPKKGHADEAVIAALRVEHPAPNPRDVFADTIRDGFSYEGPKHSGGRSIGGIFGPHVGWAGDTFYAVVADAEAAVRDHLAEHPGDTILHGADAWRMPDGLTRMTEAEYELAFAQHKVDEERASVAKSEAAA